MNMKDTKNRDTAVGITGNQDSIENWSMTERSPCSVFQAHNVAEIVQILTTARQQGFSVIAHGAGHSYTDAALNTNGIVLDVKGMCRILSWNPERGIMQVEPGVTLHEMVRVALADRWWPAVTPSTADATIGGCVAMNVNGKNAWKCGSFGEHLLSLTVLLASGQMITLSPMSDPELFHAVVGSAGLLGIITSITLQLQRIPSASVDIRVRSTTSLDDTLRILQEEQCADYLEAWVDGFASGCSLGQGIVTATTYSDRCNDTYLRLPTSSSLPEHLTEGFVRSVGTACRPLIKSGVRIANHAMYWGSKWWGSKTIRQKSLFHATYYPPLAFTSYRSLLPQGTETFQAFIPHSQAALLFKEILRYSQENHFIPLWCIIKQHRRDPFLLSYQVDGFSLEVNYPIIPETVQKQRKMLWKLMHLVIAAGGRFYLADECKWEKCLEMWLFR